MLDADEDALVDVEDDPSASGVGEPRGGALDEDLGMARGASGAPAPAAVGNCDGEAADDEWEARRKEQQQFRATAHRWVQSGAVLSDMLMFIGCILP